MSGPSHLQVPGQGQASGPPSKDKKRKKHLSSNILLLDPNGVNIGRVGIRDIIGARSVTGTKWEPNTPTGSSANGNFQFPETSATRAQAEGSALVSAVSFRIVQALERTASKVFSSTAAMEVCRYLDAAWEAGNFQSFKHIPNQLDNFCQTFRKVCTEAIGIFKWEPPLVTLASPVYVFGDIHGNFADLHFFLRELVIFGDMKYTSHNFMFLGDYVDRGDYSVECIAYLLALKCLSPTSVFMLRGNHESPEVNGDEMGYGVSSFKSQCKELFGISTGEDVWRDTNRVFTYLPLAGTIDGRIFCVHGGIPRYSGGPDKRIDTLRNDQRFPRFAVVQALAHVQEDAETRRYRQFTNDLLWSDPADDDGAEETLDMYGFGPNPRGPGTISFGSVAVDQFLEKAGFEYIFRAHQEKSDGLKLAKSGRVVTIFSTSDYSGHQNGGGVVFVSHQRIRMIIKQPSSRETQAAPLLLPLNVRKNVGASGGAQILPAINSPFEQHANEARRPSSHQTTLLAFTGSANDNQKSDSDSSDDVREYFDPLHCVVFVLPQPDLSLLHVSLFRKLSPVIKFDHWMLGPQKAVADLPANYS